MRSWLPSLLLVAPLAFTGCRPSAPVTPIVGGGGAVDPLPPQNTAYNAPPHLFSPRPHPPRQRIIAPPPPMGALPPLVNNLELCYPELRRPSPVIAQGKSKPKPKPVAKGGSSSGVGSGYGSGSGSGSGGYKNVPYQPAPPSTPPQPEPPRESKQAAASKRPGDSNSGGGRAGGAVSGSVGGVAGGVLGGATAADDAGSAGEVAKRTAQPSKRAEAEPKKKLADMQRHAEDERARPSAPSPAGAPAADYESVAAEEAPLIATAPPYNYQDDYQDWGQATYLSNDDTMSLSSAQRIIYAIDRYLPIAPSHIRQHELLNYFSFETAPVAPQDDFSVLPNLAPSPGKPGLFDLTLAVQGKPVDRDSRRNANATFVIDRSGSMSAEGRMEYLKRGLRRMTSELKTGDVVNIVLFDHEVCAPLESFVVGRDRPELLAQAIDAMRPRGATDVYSGLSRGYQLADHAYQPSYNNRVVLITDALTNTGVTDARTIALVGKFYDDRRIRLSGVGVGADFNDELLDRLTERGKGAYVFLGSEAEVDAVFGGRFISLLETTALDVHFQLHLPPSLRLNVFHGEESSAIKEEVQAIHYFANTAQLFASELMARGDALRPQDSIMLTIEYQDPETGAAMVEERAWSLGEISGESANTRKARLLLGFVQRVGALAMRSPPPSYQRRELGWVDEDAWQICDEGASALQSLSDGLSDDPEAARVRALWSKLCSRYAPPTRPVQTRPQPQPQGWPAARE